MNNHQAYQRALDALYKAHKETEAFDHGGMASNEILDSITWRLQDEFKQKPPAPDTERAEYGHCDPASPDEW